MIGIKFTCSRTKEPFIGIFRPIDDTNWAYEWASAEIPGYNAKRYDSFPIEPKRICFENFFCPHCQTEKAFVTCPRCSKEFCTFRVNGDHFDCPECSFQGQVQIDKQERERPFVAQNRLREL